MREGFVGFAIEAENPCSQEPGTAFLALKRDSSVLPYPIKCISSECCAVVACMSCRRIWVRFGSLLRFSFLPFGLVGLLNTTR